MSKDRVNWEELSRIRKIHYIWDYYKWHILFGIGLLFLTAGFLKYFVSPKEDDSFHITMVNSNAVFVYDSAYFKNFEEIYLKPHQRKVWVEADYRIRTDGSEITEAGTAYQILSAQMLGGDIDAFLSDRQTFSYLTPNGYFADLTKHLSKEQFQRLEKHLIYHVEEEGEKEIPVGVSLAESIDFQKEGFYKEEAVFGIASTSKNTAEAVQLLEYLFKTDSEAP